MEIRMLMPKKRLAALTAVVAALPGLLAAAPAQAEINNDCSGGTVAFTFDDGPDGSTPAVVDQLVSLNMKAVFFVLGSKLDTEAGRATLRDMAAKGFEIGNHTYDHQSWTGASTGTAPLTEAQVTSELEKGSDAIVAAGLPKPTLYRPPYGDVNSFDDNVAQHLGYRIVMPSGTPTGNIVDSRDWTGISTAQIASNVINGYTNNGYTYPGIKDGSIVSMHDGQGQVSLNAAAALPSIVDYMNTNHLCSTASIRPDATGGYVPAPAPTPPTSGNLVQNASLEQLRNANTPASDPVCFQQAGASTANNSAVWSQTSDAHSGVVAEKVAVSRWTAGDRKLVLTQRGSESSCLTAVTPGSQYSMWVWYKGDWAYQGPSVTKVSIATYYKDAAGAWVYWQSSPLVPPSSTWSLAYFKSSPLPAGATAVSYGLAISGVGTLTTDDYTMTK